MSLHVVFGLRVNGGMEVVVEVVEKVVEVEVVDVREVEDEL